MTAPDLPAPELAVPELAAPDRVGRVVVMGVAGCGKSQLGAALAKATGAEFVEGDALHPAANIAKMAAGTALTDADRAPWLAACGAALAAHPRAVLACSALRIGYRDALRAAVPGLRFLYLAVPEPVLAARLAARQGHFMPPALLASQLATLDVPGPEEAATLDGTLTPAAVLRAALAHL